MREVGFPPTFDGWREAARVLIAEGVAPADVLWHPIDSPPEEPERGLFEGPPPPAPPPEAGTDLRVPRAFVELARSVSVHPSADRWTLLYSVLWRLAAGDYDLMLRRDDSDLNRLRRFDAELTERGGAAPAPGAAGFVPKTSDLEALREAALACRGCDLYRHATRTVFGKGPATARAVLVGEQPGDQEDLQGAPFVGPAGEVLDRALAEAGIPRAEVYVTNAVKHFKFVRTPKRRIHQTPGSVEINACRPWLEAELAIVKPEILVCLGASASKALLGPDFRLMRERGRFLPSAWAPKVLATYHPSAVLRADDAAGQERVYRTLVSDLALVAGALGGRQGPGGGRSVATPS